MVIVYVCRICSVLAAENGFWLSKTKRVAPAFHVEKNDLPASAVIRSTRGLNSPSSLCPSLLRKIPVYFTRSQFQPMGCSDDVGYSSQRECEDGGATHPEGKILAYAQPSSVSR